MNRHSMTWISGLIAGVAFFIHAWLQNSHAWPLVWPLLAGVAVAASSGSGRGMVANLARGAGAGLVAGLVFLIATAVAIYGFGAIPDAQPQLRDQAGPVLGGLSLAALLSVVAGAVGGLVGHLFGGGRSEARG